MQKTSKNVTTALLRVFHIGLPWLPTGTSTGLNLDSLSLKGNDTLKNLGDPQFLRPGGNTGRTPGDPELMQLPQKHLFVYGQENASDHWQRRAYGSLLESMTFRIIVKPCKSPGPQSSAILADHTPLSVLLST